MNVTNNVNQMTLEDSYSIRVLLAIGLMFVGMAIIYLELSTVNLISLIACCFIRFIVPMAFIVAGLYLILKGKTTATFDKLEQKGTVTYQTYLKKVIDEFDLKKISSLNLKIATRGSTHYRPTYMIIFGFENRPEITFYLGEYDSAIIKAKQIADFLGLELKK